RQGADRVAVRRGRRRGRVAGRNYWFRWPRRAAFVAAGHRRRSPVVIAGVGTSRGRRTGAGRYRGAYDRQSCRVADRHSDDTARRPLLSVSSAAPQAAAMSSLLAEQLSLSRRGRRVLQAVDLIVEPGEVVA